MLTSLLERKPRPKRDVLMIHGAWSTGLAFHHLVMRLKDHPNVGEVHTPSYNIQTQSMTRIITTMRHLLDQEIARPTIVLGHSLGGILSLALHDSVFCHSLITVSAPIDGMSFNMFIRGLISMRSPFLADAFTGSEMMRQLHRQEYSKQIDQICTTNGFSPMITEPNDGVVTVRSQTKWKPKSANMHAVHCNHTEILVSDYLFETLKTQLETPICPTPSI